MKSYVVSRYLDTIDFDPFGNKIVVKGTCCSCEQAIFQIIKEENEKVLSYSRNYTIKDKDEKLFLTCWCTALHKYIQNEIYLCDGNPPQEKKLEEFLDEK